MEKFIYSKPKSLEKAIERLKTNGKVQILAGGTDLMGTLKEKTLPVFPKELVSLKALGLSYIKEDKDSLKIGAMTTLTELESSDAIRKYPVLWQAIHEVASPQIRNVATIGGNICQEPRCWYYRYQGNRFNCMRKDGQLCNALTGNNTYHSIFGAAKICDTSCQRACPNETEIASYMEQLRKGNIKGAADILFRVNPIAAVTGRVCPHTCQSECSRNLFDQAVSIREVEKYLGDFILDHAEEYFIAPKKELNKKAIIIGAGPAGLIAAFKLRNAGVDVTVIDKNEKIGGMLFYGIPAFRLPKNILQRIKQALSGMGIEFRMKTEVGTDITIGELKNISDVIMVGTGAWQSQELDFSHENIRNVITGIDFLNKVAAHQEIELGEKVVIIGGGNTAIDAGRTAKRMGAKSVCVAYRRTQLEMPAEESERLEAIEEGIVFKYLTAPIELLTDEKGKLKKIVLQKMRLTDLDSSGRRRPVPIDGAVEIIDADSLIIAIGQTIDTKYLPDIITGEKNEIIIDPQTYITSSDKIFAAGDAVNGPKTVVEAIAGARKAAQKILKYLGVDSKEQKSGDLAFQNVEFDLSSLEYSKANKSSALPIDKRTLYDEDLLSQQKDKIMLESYRCFNCGCVAVNPSDIAPALIVLNANVVTTERTVSASQFFAVNIESSTVLRKGEFVKEFIIPMMEADGTQEYRKFRTRKSIDFPIAGLASNIRLQEGKVNHAKLVFSGVAPIPYEFKNVETYLTGKKLTAEIAETAGKIALEDVRPLAENLFKIQLVKTFIKRAVLNAIDHE